MKYSLSLREIPKPEPEGFPEGSGYILSYMQTRVTIHTFYNSGINLPGRSILEELILCIALYTGQYGNILSI